MKKYLVLISLFLIFLMSPLVEALEVGISNVEKYSEVSDVNKIVTEESDKQNKIKKNDLIDGTTSASQLRAKKSHHVSKKNETILSVSLGLISIGIIVFFLKLLGNRK